MTLVRRPQNLGSDREEVEEQELGSEGAVEEQERPVLDGGHQGVLLLQLPNLLRQIPDLEQLDDIAGDIMCYYSCNSIHICNYLH